MKLKAQAMLKFLLSTSQHKQELLRFLPSTLAEEVQAFTPRTPVDVDPLFSTSLWSVPIHFSWFSEFLQEFPEEVRPYFLDALTPLQAEGLQKLLSLPQKKIEASPILIPFLRHLLRRSITDPDLLSEPLLPDASLNLLLNLERKHLLHLIDFLGLHDLAADLRQVVDKELLRKIHQALAPQQLHFLQYCGKQPIKWVSPKLGLSSWDGSKKQLTNLLHYRGLIRLAKAIFQEHPSFKWHLTRRFDTGRAKIIQKEFYKKQDLALLPYFKNQVLHIAKRYPV